MKSLDIIESLAEIFEGTERDRLHSELYERGYIFNSVTRKNEKALHKKSNLIEVKRGPYPPSDIPHDVTHSIFVETGKHTRDEFIEYTLAKEMALINKEKILCTDLGAGSASYWKRVLELTSKPHITAIDYYMYRNFLNENYDKGRQIFANLRSRNRRTLLGGIKQDVIFEHCFMPIFRQFEDGHRAKYNKIFKMSSENLEDNGLLIMHDWPANEVVIRTPFTPDIAYPELGFKLERVHDFFEPNVFSVYNERCIDRTYFFRKTGPCKV